ncbi:hypothetical protein [Paraburkholderia azotifigens]|uniref:Uncharacterized protein n=1 Tax=Paraburkholderia azotifigens TaxID=2057004 RepID=A0ABU9RES7_9BURK
MPTVRKWLLNVTIVLCLTVLLAPLVGRIVFSNPLSDVVFALAALLHIYGDEDVDSLSIGLSFVISFALALITIRAITLAIKKHKSQG